MSDFNKFACSRFFDQTGFIVQSSVKTPQPASASVAQPSRRDVTVVQAEAVEARQTREYEAAMELEMWKEQQETMFQSKV